MAQVNCPKCGHPVEPSMTECPMCGVIFKKYQAGVLKAQKAFEKKAQQAKQEQLKKLKKCPACSAVISKRAAACPQCGEPQEVPADHLPGTEKIRIGSGRFPVHFIHHPTACESCLYAGPRNRRCRRDYVCGDGFIRHRFFPGCRHVVSDADYHHENWLRECSAVIQARGKHQVLTC